MTHLYSLFISSYMPTLIDTYTCGVWKKICYHSKQMWKNTEHNENTHTHARTHAHTHTRTHTRTYAHAHAHAHIRTKTVHNFWSLDRKQMEAKNFIKTTVSQPFPPSCLCSSESKALNIIVSGKQSVKRDAWVKK